ncbi:hypothetical protein AKJ50_02530 [candidate division MSBL1 archaeon SCGC-AAA382A13]|uniref:DNA-binding protein n=1 Tax=candidate division MSBL1 archaeon SCGC-AAA382A13 TaxID=1698279 RepID=A0A133VCZ9_9EURY|nr:hypothetical protein AKJ50_02530 [candidate division MSBL1 archaeon SCGC-AAA382A13]
MPESLKDMREVTLKYEIPIEQTKTFWKELEEGKLYTSKCKECGEIMFPPQSYCRNCLKSDIEWIELDGAATIQGFTHIIIRPKSFSDEEPYTIGVGEFKHHKGVKALAWIEGFKMSEVEVGMDADLVPKQREDGPPYYVFVPIEERR